MTPTGIYVVIAILGTLAYGLGTFAIWGDPGFAKVHRWHQHWFNMVGAAIGWIAGYPVFQGWILSGERPTGATIFLLLLAFIGVTGTLPQFLMNSRWWYRPSNGVKLASVSDPTRSRLP
jgi:hypothetical protein